MSVEHQFVSIQVRCINLQFQVKKLFIGDLKNKDLTADDLEDYFGKFGRIKDAVIMEKDGVSRG